MAPYFLIDSGEQQKLEQFGDYRLIRPCAAAIWKKKCPAKMWESADALFTRENGNRWVMKKRLPEHWIVTIENIRFKVSPTDFGHLGVFPEHSILWKWMTDKIKTRKQSNILNLFAYSGGASLAAAQAGAKVCHLDASKGMVSWARENAALNNLQDAPIRWIIEDVFKFLMREIKRGVSYDGIILDPPSFGRGNKGEMFKIEAHLLELLELCKKLLSKNPLFTIFTTHTPGFSPLIMENILSQILPGPIESGEMILTAKESYSLPFGSFARWSQ